MDQKLLEQFEIILKKSLQNLVTKADAKRFATKDDINLLRQELKSVEKRLTKEIELSH